jgi:hypothetical protein
LDVASADRSLHGILGPETENWTATTLIAGHEMMGHGMMGREEVELGMIVTVIVIYPPGSRMRENHATQRKMRRPIIPPASDITENRTTTTSTKLNSSVPAASSAQPKKIDPVDREIQEKVALGLTEEYLNSLRGPRREPSLAPTELRRVCHSESRRMLKFLNRSLTLHRHRNSSTGRALSRRRFAVADVSYTSSTFTKLPVRI